MHTNHTAQAGSCLIPAPTQCELGAVRLLQVFEEVDVGVTVNGDSTGWERCGTSLLYSPDLARPTRSGPPAIAPMGQRRLPWRTSP